MGVTRAASLGAPPRPHAVVFPFPAQGCVRPLMQLARCLTGAHGFKVTFANTSWIHKRLGFHDTTRVEDDVHFVDLQEGIPDDYFIEMGQDLLNAFAALGPFLEEFLRKLELESSPITCVISDLFFIEPHQTAIRLGLPSVGFNTQCALALSAKYFSPRLVDGGHLPLPRDPSGGPENMTRTMYRVLSAEDAAALARIVTCVPGIHPMPLGNFHMGVLTRDLADPLYQYFTSGMRTSLHGRSWTLVNTFHEFEAPVIEALRDVGGVPVTAIGPLVITPTTRDGTFDPNDEESSSYWPAEAECLEWLDKQKPASVVYVAFGSLMNLTSSMLEEFVLGLEDSCVPFLLVVRPNLVNSPRPDIARGLPPGFEERTKDRALIVSWTPQLKVLAHPATAGFVTHCGWNSLLESISMGVPMLGYPYSFDQPMNNRYNVCVWKTGLEFERRADGSVERRDVAKKVRALAAEDAGVRAATLTWKDIARRAVEPGGSSHNNMTAFVADMYKRAHQAAALSS